MKLINLCCSGTLGSLCPEVTAQILPPMKTPDFARIPAGFVPKLGLVLGSGKSSARVLVKN